MSDEEKAGTTTPAADVATTLDALAQALLNMGITPAEVGQILAAGADATQGGDDDLG